MVTVVSIALGVLVAVAGFEAVVEGRAALARQRVRPPA
jgi:hypothetical protein